VKILYTNTKSPYPNIERLGNSGLVAPAIPVEELISKIKLDRQPDAWPNYQRCVDGAPIATHGDPDISRANYTWAKIALQKFRWIQEPEKVIEKLFELSHKTGEWEYCRMTVENELRDSPLSISEHSKLHTQ
jgi:hypothetical protein